MEAGDYLEVSVALEQMNKSMNKVYWTSKCEEIVKGVCALLNSFGGKLCINIENQDLVDFENILDKVIKAIEQRLKHFMSLWWLNKLVKMPKIQNKQYVYEISNSDKVFTMKYHLYLPTAKQVEEISPCDHEALEKIIKGMSFSREGVQNHLSRVNQFIFGKSISPTESGSIQFKYLLNEKSKKTTIADRIINKTNKLIITISAFANQSGGHVLYGISNEGIVQGQVLEGKDKSEIEAKVTKEINKMIWKKAIERGKHWRKLPYIS
jgi:predicted HTH transcriptional regulator